MPLYEIWYEGTPNEVIYAGLHCTAGDALIAGFALMIMDMVIRSAGSGNRWEQNLRV